MKSILICSFSNLSTDSRIIRYIGSVPSNYDIFVAGCGDKPSVIGGRFNYIDLHYKAKRKNKNIREFIEYNLSLKLKLYSAVRRINPDIVHCNDFETLLPSYMALSQRRSKIIYDTHELWTGRIGVNKSLFHKLINSLDALLENLICRKLSHIITVSDSISEYLASAYNINKPAVIRNIPLTESDCSSCDSKVDEVFSKLTGKLLFVYIGPVSKERNIPLLIRTFRKANINNAHLVLIGKNQLGESLIDDKITFIDEVLEKDICCYLKRCDIGVHPLSTDSCLNHEFALPNKVFQYMQAGLALFVFKNRETENIINIYKNGFTADFANEKSILESFKSISESDVSSLKLNSLNSFRTYFGWENEKIKYLSVLYSVDKHSF